MNVAFINENTLGHTSYLPRFAGALRMCPELGVVPHVIDVLPLPPELRRLGDTSVRGLRKFGLDFHGTRWRMAISRHARSQLDDLRRRVRIDAVVVNTQSAGLELGALPGELPTLVALDATFRQLADSPWFGPNRLSRWLQPVTLSGLIRRETKLLTSATRLLPWSELVAASLRRDYGVVDEKITVLPPSLAEPEVSLHRPERTRPQFLFLGGDFVRKGGPLLLEVFRSRWAGRAELHLVTQSEVPTEAGVIVHRGVSAGSREWLDRWQQADLFVFPSRLETFGIVLLEALAFAVPIVSSAAGAARDILERGRLGTLVDPLDGDRLALAIEAVMGQRETARAQAELGRESFRERFELGRNVERLAELLHRQVRPDR